MICPCKGCPHAGCGDLHDSCEPYQQWKAERERTNKWLRDQMQPTSEAGIKGRNERLRHGKSRKWNVKTKHDGGDGRW